MTAALTRRRRIAMLQGGFIVLALLPAVAMFAGASPFPASGEHNAGPLRDSGLTALLLAVFATAVPTLRERLGLPWLLRLRQPIGALAFAYACVHGLLAVRGEGGSTVRELLHATVATPALLAGWAAFVLALPLMATGNRFALRWLGAPLWQDIQRSLGIATALATAHAIAVVAPGPRFVLVLLAACGLLWVAFAAALLLRDRLRQPMPPARPADRQPLRFYRKRPR